MKRLLGTILLFFILIYLGSCEKDDICVEGDTPFLVITFIDTADNTSRKEVPNLRIREIGQENVIDYNANIDLRSYHQDRVDTDSTTIPLRITDSISAFILINNSRNNDDNVELGTSDTLILNYTVSEKFVSRACGFVANFTLDTTQPVPTTNNWIDRVEITEPFVEAENVTHVQIYH